MDGATEDKTFAPGYGEFSTSDGTDTEALALAVPTDAAEAPLPEQLTALVETAYAVEEMAEAGDWAAASSSSDAMRHDWEEYAAGDVPVPFGPVMSEALDRLSEGIGAEDSVAAIQAALDVARLAIDLQLRYRPPSEVDVARLGVWSRQLMLDAAEEDPGSVRGDLFAIDYVRDRDLGLEPADVTRLNYLLEEMHNLMAEDDLPGVAEAADLLEDFVTEVEGG